MPAPRVSVPAEPVRVALGSHASATTACAAVRPLRVTLVATPDTQVGPLSGLYEALNAFPLLATLESDLPTNPFEVEIVAPDGASGAAARGASGLPLGAHRTYAEVERTDIVVLPLMMFAERRWVTGRYPGLVAWLRRQHEHGALLASTCTGVLLLAETGLLRGREATLHWAFAPTFRENFPDVRLRTEQVLITSGEDREFVMTGGITSWHDLALHLIARYVGPTAARAMGRLLMLEWHGDGQAPYIEFVPRIGHGDAEVREAQRWLAAHLDASHPVDRIVARSGLSRRTLERRFRSATGHAPIGYVQHLRVAEAKRRLERSAQPVEEIALAVGYENTAFFRSLFKRTTHLTPGAYRRKFRLRGLDGAD